MPTLSQLSPGKTFTLEHVFEKKMTRTGSFDDGSCFFHSLFTSINTLYKKMNKKQKMEYVNETRKKISNNVTLEKWRTLGNKSLSTISISRWIWIYFDLYYNFITENKTNEKIENYLKELKTKRLDVRHYNQDKEVVTS